MYGLHDGEVHARALRYIAGGGSSGTSAAEPGRQVPDGAVPAGLLPPRAMPFTYTTNLSEVRALVRLHARQAGLPESRANDLVIAVSEAAANTVRSSLSCRLAKSWFCYCTHPFYAAIVCFLRAQPGDPNLVVTVRTLMAQPLSRQMAEWKKR